MKSNDARMIDVAVRQGEDSFTVQALPGQTVAQAVWLSGIVSPAALCSGLGRCGACRVRFVQGTPDPVPVEGQVLGATLLEQGERLACRHGVVAGMTVEVPAAVSLSVEGARAGRTAANAAGCLSGDIALAVDLGTTSIWWKAFGSGGQRPDMELFGHELNPQLGAGSDVMSRVATALVPEGRTRLRELVLNRLRDLVQRTGASRLCVAGNTAMTAILLDADCSGLAGAPYSLPERGNREVTLPGLPPVWIPLQPAPFVGGDVSAGLAAVLASNPAFPFLLADMGTNGEFALMTDANTLWLASVPLGPSLEGIGLACGTLARPGAVTGFTLDPTGLAARVFPGDAGTAKGISGTGYLALMHILRTQGVLNEGGIPVASPSSPLARRLAAGISRPEDGPWHMALPYNLILMATDVEEIIKVRAAFSLAVARLLQAANLRPTDIGGVHLAGALGEHVSAQALEGLGFLPAGLGARLHPVGNTSLAGAELLLRRPELRDPLARLCEQACILELTAAPDFMMAYMERMRLTAFQI